MLLLIVTDYAGEHEHFIWILCMIANESWFFIEY